MIEYRLALAERSTTGQGAEIISDVFDLVGDIADSGLQYIERLNEPGTLEFALPLDHSSVTQANFAVGKRELYLYRNEGLGEVLVWGGKLWTVDVDGWMGRFICYDFLHDLRRRVVHADYAVTSTDVYDMIWDLVAASQARTDGGLGITRDFTTRGVNRKLVVCFEERRPILDVIDELAGEQGSFDFRVSPDKKLQVYAPQRGGSTTVVFNEQNMTTFRHRADGTTLETVVGVIGPAQDCDVPSLYEATDLALTDDYGVLDGTVDNDQIQDDTRREKTADKQLLERKVVALAPQVSFQTPLQEWNEEQVTGFDVQFFDVGVGDNVAVSTSSGPAGGFLEFNGTFRVMEKRVDVRRPGMETVTLTLDPVVIT